MSPKEIFDNLKQVFSAEGGSASGGGEAILDGKFEGVLDPYVKISPTKFKEIALYLRDDISLRFDFLMCLSGVDYTKGLLGAVYHLFSMEKHHKITIKVEVPVDKPEIPSMVDVWSSANWHEREAYDLFGINFIGHPDLRRILLPDDWDGYPLRKDFKVPEFYQGMKVPY
ncbi:MAG TPA: NADH-quinone oxidoreductase subunit C [Bacteroidota bacterium]|nr:NADH-quinone oxidoreductase subunit C [Bacteroidota bacterium]